MPTKEFLAYLSFSSFPGIGPLRFKLLLQYFETAETAWTASSSDYKKVGLPESLIKKLIDFRNTFSAEKYYEEIQKKKIHVVTWGSPHYPKKLKEISDPPFLLYIKGDMTKITNWERAVGVVGTRKITRYGTEVTRKIVEDLVDANCLIVSGLAYGVDAVAHTTAIENDGLTVAVLGCGVDVIHPVSNARLYHEIENGKGIILSEYPVGQYASKGLFPARNRIISGLSLGTVITEGAVSSGSLITARLALEQGREVFAVPGPITSSLSDGPLSLIKEGATPIGSGREVLEALGLTIKLRKKKFEIRNIDLSKDEKTIIEVLENESLHIDDIAIKTKLSPTHLGGVLTMMELKGIVKNMSGVWGLS